MPDDRLDELLLDWQSHFGRGRDVPAAELCAGCPELAPELERRIAAVRHLASLAGEVGDASARSPATGPEVNFVAAWRTAPLGVTWDAGPGACPAADDDPRPANLPDRYRNVRPHRAGGLGRVWLAHDDLLGRDVALKELRLDRGHDPQLRARFLEEARVTSQLEHPGIVPVYDLIDRPLADGGPLYTMRFVSGRTLSEAIREYHGHRNDAAATRLELTALLDAFASVCRAVAYAHSRDVLHRDLKGDNVILGNFGEVFVLDWGLAKVFGGGLDMATPAPFAGDAPREATQAGTVFGTPAFMSPQMVDGEPADVASDIYALGVVLYVLLTGRLPHEGHSAGEVLERVRRGTPSPPRAVEPSVPQPLDAVCRKAMAHDPAGRYATAEALADDVRRWLVDEPVLAYPDPWAVRLGRVARRHRTKVVGAGVFLCSAVVALAVSTGLIWREQQQTEANFDAARRLTLDVLREAEGLAGVPRAEPIREQMTNRSLQTLQQFLPQRPHDRELKQTLATLLRYSANVRRNRNELSEADASYLAAIELLEDRIAADPASEAGRSQLCETLRDRADVLARRGNLPAALAALERSVALARGLCPAAVGPAKHGRKLATALVELAEVQYARGQYRASKAAADESIKWFAAFTAPARPLQDDLLQAVAEAGLADACRGLDQPNEAAKFYGDSLGRIEALRKDARADANVSVAAQHFLARGKVGRAQALAGRPQAETDLNEAIQIWKQLRKEFRSAVTYAEWEAVARTIRARVHRAAGRAGPAEDDLKRARTTLEDMVGKFAEVPAYRGHLGRVYLELGRVARQRRDAAGAGVWFGRAATELDAANAAAPGHTRDLLSLQEVRDERAGQPAGGPAKPPAPK